jgi:DNA-binding CsgD family transcriptional regulator
MGRRHRRVLVRSQGAAQLVGRERELAALDVFLETAASGPCALELEGEAGVGKTTLWEAAVDMARERLYWVLTCRPAEPEAKLGYASLSDLLDTVIDETLAELPDPQREALEVALLRRGTGDVRAEPRAVSTAVSNTLRALARIGPVLVAIDDLQWLDPSSERALAFAIRRLEHEPVAVLGTRRSERGSASLLAFERLTVEPLTCRDLGVLLTGHASFAAPRRALNQIYRLSGGNPFYALEITRSVSAQEEPLADGRLAVPPNLRALVAERLTALPVTTRRALLPAAALATPTISVIARVTGRRDERVPALAKAEAAGVIELDGDLIRFTHPLLASAVYAEATAATRRSMHRRLASVLEDPEEQAHHLALAASGPDPRLAAVIEAAADRARSRGDWDGAVELMELALGLTPRDCTEDRRRRALKAGEQNRDTGNFERAENLLRDLVSESPDRAVRSRAQHLLGLTAWFRGETEQSLGLLRTASLEAEDPCHRATIERDAGMLLAMNNEPLRAAPHLAFAQEVSEQLGDPTLLAGTLPAVAMGEFAAGRGIPVDLLERALELEEFVAAERTVVRPRFALASILAQAGEITSARPRLEELHRQASDSGDAPYQAELGFELGMLELWAGRWEQSRYYLDRALEDARHIDSEVLTQILLARALLDAHVGNVAATTAALGEARRAGRFQLAAQTAELAGVESFLSLSCGDPEEAAAALDGLAERMHASGVAEPSLFRFLPDQIEALLALGRIDEAAVHVSWLEERGRVLDRPWALATGARCGALLALAEARPEDAVTAAERALREHEGMPMPFEHARTLLVHGLVLRAARQQRRARDAFEQALATFERLGANLWRERAEAELRSMPGRRPATQDALTETEERIARLVASGRTNDEVARTLFLSPKTVEWNLSKVYRKLHIHSRTELASKLGVLR